jgi:hypothetical protein
MRGEPYHLMGFNLKAILIGKATRNEQGIYLVVLVAFLMVCLGLSQLVYPDGYHWTHRFISEEGNHVGNPNGWIFFTFGICTSALLVIPHSIYIYRHLQPQVLLFARFILFLLLVGSIGLFIVGAISEEHNVPHNTGSALAFGGYGFAVFCSFLICIRRLFLKAHWPTIPQFFLLFGILFAMGIIIGYGMATYPAGETQRFQWTGLFTILTYFFGMYLIIPEAKTNQ